MKDFRNSMLRILYALIAILPGPATLQRSAFWLRFRSTLKPVIYVCALLLFAISCSQLFRAQSHAGAKTDSISAKAKPAQAAGPAVYGDYPDREQYSPLTQVNRTNVKNLRVAWTYDEGQAGAAFEATPIVVGNRMYFPTPDSKVVALDAMTGKEVWKFDPVLKFSRVSRGVAYYPGGPHTSARILFGTADGRLIALDPKTGQLIPDFANAGQVDVSKMATQGFPNSRLGYSSPPAILRDKVIVTPFLQESPALGPTGNGDPRAFDVTTGQLLWQFHSMPRAGEPGADSWGTEGTVNRSGPSAWVPNAVDPKRNMAFVITGNPAGTSPYGLNLYTNSVLALDGKTGKLAWYFQLVHHDIWDFDSLDVAVIDVHRGSAIVPAVVAVNKSGTLFILDEMTGKPFFKVEERPVPQSDSDEPGEKTWPTQPVEVLPPPITRTSMLDEDLANLSPDSAKFCRDLLDRGRHGTAFTPVLESAPGVNFPSSIGGPNWDSVSFSPKVGYMFVSTSEWGADGVPPAGPHKPMPPSAGGPGSPGGPGAGAPRRRGMGNIRFVDQSGYPCQQPPWGMLTAINPSTGKIVWRVPLGDYGSIDESKPTKPSVTSLPEGPGKDLVQSSCNTACHGLGETLQSRQSRAGWTSMVGSMAVGVSTAEKDAMIDYLAKNFAPVETPASAAAPAPASASASASGKAHQPTGTPNLGGPMVTAGNLVFIGATLDNKVRAFDALTGKELWSFQLDGVGEATPMSFLGSDGRQYIAIASGGPGLLGAAHNTAGNSPDKIVVFALPK